jgi:predicted RNase H-like HicB family nuclease
MISYIALIRKEAKSDYGVDFPDFPGCITAGSTLDEARELAHEALLAHIDLMQESGEALPEATSLEKIMSSSENKDAVAILVSVPVKSKAVRFNATIDQDLLKAIDNKAKTLGKSRSAFLADAARDALKNNESYY